MWLDIFDKVHEMNNFGFVIRSSPWSTILCGDLAVELLCTAVDSSKTEVQNGNALLERRALCTTKVVDMKSAR